MTIVRKKAGEGRRIMPGAIPGLLVVLLAATGIVACSAPAVQPALVAPDAGAAMPGTGLNVPEAPSSLPESSSVPIERDITACGFACGWVDSDTLRVTLFDDKTRFDFDSDTVNAEGLDRLKRLATILNRVPESTLRVDGYSDSHGTEAVKLAISQRRADNVARRLRELGVSATRFEGVEGRSDSDPIVSNAIDAGRPTNRRVELHIHHLKVQ